jgi:hypothetical protein
MSIFGRVVRWLRGRPVWAGNRYDPGDTDRNPYSCMIYLMLSFNAVMSWLRIVVWPGVRCLNCWTYGFLRLA